MSKMIQIRNVPDDLHRRVKARAAREGLSLSEYLLQEVRRLVELPSLDELRERLRSRSRVTPRVSTQDAVREERSKR